MILNILHRPDKPERRALFELEQKYAHDNGIRTTILMTAEALSDPGQVAMAQQYAADFGDEIGLSFHGLTHESVVDRVGYGQEALWLFTLEQKRTIIEFLAAQFTQAFGFSPTSAASYHLDSSTMAILRDVLPSVRATVAGCFEEGVRVFHGCNHSWYLFNEGMPWGPWYPSKTHTLRPARDEDDWAGVVAVPHLMRDMVLSYEGRNDFWASHPPNVMRGMGYEGENCPYDRNLIDMFRWQEQFNGGYSYYTSFVSTAWLAEHHAIDDSPEVAQSLYRQQLEYLGELKRTGDVEVTTLTEFADWYRAHRSFGEPEVYFAKELLYGSGKHYVWYRDSDQRVLLDATQGGSIGDLRPYAGEVAVTTGPESESLAIGSYPFLVQSQHRTGMQNHFQDGSRSTALVSYNGEEIDLGSIPTRVASVERGDRNSAGEGDYGPTVVRLASQSFEVGGQSVTVETRVTFEPGGTTRIMRHWKASKPVTLTERIKLSPGVTEYPQPLHGVRLAVSGASSGEPKTLEYSYSGASIDRAPCSSVEASFPMVSSQVSLSPSDAHSWSGTASDGHLFSPYVTLTLTRSVSPEEESEVCIQISKL